MEDVQRRKLSELVRHAASRSPFYSTLDPDAFDADEERQFQNLPLIDKQILRRQWVRFLSAADDTSTWRKVRTTGTTGTPLDLVVDPAYLAAESEAFCAHLDFVLGAPAWQSCRVVYLVLQSSAVSRTLAAPWHPNASAVKWNLSQVWTATDEEFVDALAALDGCVVSALPSVAELICLRLKACRARRPAAPVLFVLSGEMVRPGVRQLIGDCFACPTTSLYSMAEVGIVAGEVSPEPVYRVAASSCIVEILDGEGQPVEPGQTGEVVVSPLNNRAMPLLRYRTGDRGAWIDGAGAGRDFRLVDAREPQQLFDGAGRAVSTLRFRKLITMLPVAACRFVQLSPSRIEFAYVNVAQPLDARAARLVESAVRAQLGAETLVTFRRVDRVDALPDIRPGATMPRPDIVPLGNVELTELIGWIRGLIGADDRISLAVVTGSALDTGMTTRFSDFDLVMLCESSGDLEALVDVSARLCAGHPKLSVHADLVDAFSRRAPLLAARIRAQHVVVKGALDDARLPPPGVDDIRRDGISWCQMAMAELWLRLVSARKGESDVLQDAWLSAKAWLNAGRYASCAEGLDALASEELVAWITVAFADESGPLCEAFDVARERMPPPREREAPARYLSAALRAVRAAQSRLMSV